jgi:CheY-like chemotaxis protein
MNKIVLYIDDDENDIWLFKHAMDKAGTGCSVRHAKDGQAAIDYFAGAGNSELARESPLPDLVLLDLKLPEVPGLEVLKWMRTEAALRIPILILSSSQNDRDVATAYELGANGYLVKPCDLGELQEMARMIRGFWLVQNTPPPSGKMSSSRGLVRQARPNNEARESPLVSI